MTRAWAACGCVHRQIGGGQPGHVVLEQPPAVLAARGTLPAKPLPAPAVVVSAGAILDWGERCSGSCAPEGTLGFELGLYFTRVNRGETFQASDPHDIGRVPWELGVNVGWTPPETRTLTLAVPQPTMYVELQGRYHFFFGLAAGVAVTPGDGRAGRNGVQLAEMLGPFYLRQQLLFDSSFALSAGVAVKLPVTLSF